MARRTLHRLLPGLVLSAVASASVFGATDATLVGGFLASDFVPWSSSRVDADGFWSIGTSNGIPTMLRYEADGSIRFARFPQMVDVATVTMHVYRLPDGGALTTDEEDANDAVFTARSCKLRGFDANGMGGWVSDLAQNAIYPYSPWCADVSVDGTGMAWMYPAGNFQIAMLAGDISTATLIDAPPLSNDRFIADKTTRTAYFAGTEASGQNYLAAIARMDPGGVQWTATVPFSDGNSMLFDIAQSPDGSVWAFGRDADKLFGMHVSPAGDVLWSGSFVAAASPVAARLAVRADGGVSVLYWGENAQAPGANPQLIRIDVAGHKMWDVNTAFALTPVGAPPYVAIEAAANGDTVIAYTFFAGSPDSLAVDVRNYFGDARFDSSGHKLFQAPQQTIIAAAPPALGVFADGTSLATGAGFDRRARGGQAITDPRMMSMTTCTSWDDTVATGADGSLYFVVSNDDRKSFGVIAYSANDTLLWHAEANGTWDHGGLKYPATVIAGQNVCVVGPLDLEEIVQCFALSDGTPASRSVLSTALPDQFAQIGHASSTPDGSVVAVYQANDAKIHHALIDRYGVLIHDATPAVLQSYADFVFSTSGDVWLITSDSRMVKLSPAGEVDVDVAVDAAMEELRPLPDGSGAILNSTKPPIHLQKVDTAGNRAWDSVMPDGIYTWVRGSQFGDDALFTILDSMQIAPGTTRTVNTLAVKVNLADGTLAWHSPTSYRFFSPPLTRLDADADFVLISSIGPYSTFTKLANGDGQPLESVDVPCSVDNCQIWDAAYQQDGALRMVFDTSDLVTGSAWEIRRLNGDPDKIFSDGYEATNP